MCVVQKTPERTTYIFGPRLGRALDSKRVTFLGRGCAGETTESEWSTFHSTNLQVRKRAVLIRGCVWECGVDVHHTSGEEVQRYYSAVAFDGSRIRTGQTAGLTDTMPLWVAATCRT